MPEIADPLFHVDGGGRVVHWNAACESAFGQSAAAVVGQRLPGPLAPNFDEELLGQLGRIGRDGHASFLPSVRIAGSLWDVRLTRSPELDTVAVYCIPSGAGAANWVQLVADSVDAIWVVDNEDRVTAWNRGAEEMFGYTAGEIIGQPVARLVPADLLEARELDRLEKALLELGAVRDYETRRRTRDGRELAVSLTRTPLRDRSGQVVGSSTIVRDLSQRRQIERQIVESEKLATLGELAGSVAQEIGAPLTTIRLVIENLRRGSADGSGNGDQLDTVVQQLDRIGRLTRGLVELAKPGELKLRPVEPEDVIRRALELVEPSLRRAGVRIELEIEGRLPTIEADAGQLQQALLNLLMNAKHAFEPKGGLVRMEARVRRGLPAEGHPVRSALEIAVIDDGPGIDAADLPYIFRPFFSRSGGSGLGLPAAKQIVHAHGGSLEAESKPGEGATFTIHLPVEANE